MPTMKEVYEAAVKSKPVQGLKEAGNAVKKPIMSGYSTIKSDVKTFMRPTTTPKPMPTKTIRKKAKEIEEAL